MAQKQKSQATPSRLRGWIYFTLWGLLIVAGIVAKRVYGHPDMMVFFHLPAAVFLVMATHVLSADVRRKYRETLRTKTQKWAR